MADKIKMAFSRVKEDMEDLRLQVRTLKLENSMLKENSDRWIRYLDKENKMLKTRLEKLERDLVSSRLQRIVV